MKRKLYLALASGLLLGAALPAAAENNNDFKRDINATSMGTRMRDAASESAPRYDTRENRLAAEREETERAATVEDKKTETVATEATTAVEHNAAANGMTAENQSNKPADIELTRKIRAELMDQNMSMKARNVKIITMDGKVTLKGEVESNTEKSKIQNIARKHAGAGKVTNDLKIQK